MKYTRVDITKREGNFNFLLWFKFFILLPLLAIIIGAGISKKIITPWIKNNTGEVSQSNIKYDITNFYVVQAGVFTNENNAKSLSGLINENGFKSIVICDKSLYRIIINIFSEKSKSEETKNNLKALGYDCIINEVGMNSLYFQNFDKKDMKQYINLISSNINLQVNIWDSQKANSELISEYKKNMDSIMALNGNTRDDSIKKFLDISNKYFNEIKEGKYENCLNYISEEMFILKDCIQVNN